MAHRLAPQALADLDNIWSYIFKESGGTVAADNVVDAITERSTCSVSFRAWAAHAMICAPACAAFRWLSM
jgi:plasmid stabilization system protein ParE